MTSRKGRGRGNNYGKAWQESPLWDSLPAKTDGCKHLNTKFTAAGQECKNCGELLPGKL